MSEPQSTAKKQDLSDIDHIQLENSDAISIVSELSELINIDASSRKKRILLMESLAAITDSDCWIWTLIPPLDPGDQAIAVDSIYGGFAQNQFARYLEAIEHPQMGELNAPFIKATYRRARQTTMLRQQIDPHNTFAGMDVEKYWEKANIGPLCLSARPFENGSLSLAGFYRKLERPQYTKREAQIIQLILRHSDWLHASLDTIKDLTITQEIKTLSPRLRTVLNLLLDGHGRKEIAESLTLSSHTVAGYIKELYKFYDVHSQTELLKRFRDSY